MRVDPIDVVGLLVRDGVPEPLPGPDGKLRPPVPLGRRVELPGRGTTFVREVAGPPGAPTVLLVHGLGASGGLNWFRTFEMLGAEFRVLAPDLRGHGRGVRSPQAFRLADCADDLAALLDVLATGPVLVAGYSMGGPVAQLLSRRHPERVAGLVLCATATRFSRGPLGARPLDVALGLVVAGARFGEHATSVPSAPLRALRTLRSSRPAGFRAVDDRGVPPSRPASPPRSRTCGERLRRRYLAPRARRFPRRSWSRRVTGWCRRASSSRRRR